MSKCPSCGGKKDRRSKNCRGCRVMPSDPSDNRIENLELVVSHSEHIREHMLDWPRNINGTWSSHATPI